MSSASFRESREGAHLLFQLCSALYERVAVIITSTLKFGEWKSVLGEEHLTAALLDRLTHRAHILEFLGESFRFRQRVQQAERQRPPVEVADPAIARASEASRSG
jgi:DNA replication protein DnaC